MPVSGFDYCPYERLPRIGVRRPKKKCFKGSKAAKKLSRR